MSLEQYPNLENLPFIPDREPDSEIDSDTIESLKKYGAVMVEMIRNHREATLNHNKEARHQEVKLGQKAGKMWCRSVEGLPVEKQTIAIRKMDQIASIVHEKYGVDCSSYISGFKGEFATGVLLDHSGLWVYYPQEEEDLTEMSDWIAVTPHEEGEPYQELRIQTKTLSLPRVLNRKNSDLIMPIFSRLQTDDDMESFETKLLNIAYEQDSQLVRGKIVEIVETAKKMRGVVAEGTIPVICILGNPTSGGSDIDPRSAQPTSAAQTQAIMELNQIIGAETAVKIN